MTRRERKRPDWEDDGRVIARMDAEGMPKPRRKRTAFADAPKPEEARNRELLSPRETRRVMLAGMKWAFLFSAGLMLLLVLFVLFCVKVWLA